MKKLFNIEYLLHNESKHYQTTMMHPYSLKALQWYQNTQPWGDGDCGLGVLNMTNK
jgi:hypothetical protein